VSLSAASLGLWHTLNLRDTALEAAYKAKVRAEEEQQKAESSERQVRDLLLAADLRLAGQFLKNGEVQPLRALLDRHGDDGTEGPGFLWRYFDRLVHVAAADALRHPGGVTHAALSPDGHLLATADGSGTIRLWHLLSGEPRGTLTVRAGISWLAFLADGRTLATADGDRVVRFWDVAAGRETNQFVPPHANVVRLAVAPDGGLVAAAQSDGSLRVYEVAGRKQRWHLQRHNEPVEALAFAPDRPLLASAGQDDTVRLWDLTTGHQVQSYWHDGDVTCLTFSPNGWFLATGQPSGRVRVFNVARLNLEAVYGSVEETFRAHTGPVRALAFSFDGERLATGSEDATVRLYDVRQRSVQETYRGHADAVTAVAFVGSEREFLTTGRDGAIKRWPAEPQDSRRLALSLRPAGPLGLSSDGKTLAVACRDGTVQLHDRANGSVITLAGHRGEVRAVAFQPGGGLVATAGLDLAVRLWARDGRLHRTLAVPDLPLALAFAPDGKLLTAGLNNGSVVSWDAAEGAARATLHGHTGPVFAVAFAPSGVLATAGADRTVRQWDAAAGVERAPPLQRPEPVRALAWAHRERWLAAGSGHRLTQWDASTGKPLSDWQLPNPVAAVAYLPDDRSLAFAEGSSVRVIETPRVEERVWLQFGHNDQVRALLVAPEAGTLVTADGERVQEWDLPASRMRRLAGQRPGPVTSLAFAPDGRTLYSGSSGPLVEVLRTLGRIGNNRAHVLRPDDVRAWDVSTGRERPALPDQRAPGVECLTITADGSLLLAGSRGGALWRWDLAEGRRLPTCFVSPHAERFWTLMEAAKQLWPTRPVYEDTVRAITASPDGRHWATAHDGGVVQLWDAATAEVRVRLPLKHADVRAVAFGPDGTTLAVNDGAAIQIWEVATGEPLRRLEGHKAVLTCLAYSPNGRWLASGGQDRHLGLWAVAEGTVQMRIGHGEAVAAVAFSPDGRTLASGGADGLVRLWQVATAQEMAALEGHSGRVRALAFAPDGKTLASGGETPNGSGEICFWEAGVPLQRGSGGENGP
jgi:WD40 repeat protein